MQSRVRRSRRPVELSTAMRGRSQRELTLGPHLLYPAKAAYTRARSYAWKHTGRGAPDTYSGIRILFYHRISDDRDELAVSPRCFIEQLTHLAVEGYRVVDVATAGRLLAAGEIGERTIGLSFDDGYRDVAETALPELERLGFAASVFVVPGAVDGAVRFGWYRHRPALLTWEQIARLDASTPLCIEAHSLTHPNLLATDAATVEREIVGSKRVLEERLGREVEAFSYPAGLFSARERRVVEHAGYRVAVSTEPGVNGHGTDLLALMRTQIEHRDSLLDFRAKLAGAHDSAPPLRNAYRRYRHGGSA